MVLWHQGDSTLFKFSCHLSPQIEGHTPQSVFYLECLSANEMEIMDYTPKGDNSSLLACAVEDRRSFMNPVALFSAAKGKPICPM